MGKEILPALKCAVAAGLAALCLTGCATGPHRSSTHALTGESVVLAGEQPARLAFAPAAKGPIQVRSTYLDNLTNTIHYQEGRDYTLDRAAAQIRRTADSRIPDFQTNLLFGKEDFDHSKFPGYGNQGFFVFVDYDAGGQANWLWPEKQLKWLPKTRGKLKAGKPLKIVALGDSITAGGDASQPALIYWQRWAGALRHKYPRAQITALNGATGGDTTRNGLQRLQEKVLQQKPDLVLVAFGMNDNNNPPFGVPVAEFAANLGTIIDRIRSETSAEIILVSAFPPNPKWHYGSKAMNTYAETTGKVAAEKQCAFADVYHNWVRFSASKKPEDLLANNINHPNDFGHWIYFQVLAGLGL